MKPGKEGVAPVISMEEIMPDRRSTGSYAVSWMEYAYA